MIKKCKKIIKNRNNELIYFYNNYIELCTKYNRIWIKTKKLAINQNFENNINILLNKNFFIHMMGLKKLSKYSKISVNDISKQIINNKITFDTISKDIYSHVKKYGKTIHIQHIFQKLASIIEMDISIKNCKFEKIVFDIKFIKNSPNLDFIIYKKIHDFFHCFGIQKIEKNYKLNNISIFKSLINYKINECCKNRNIKSCKNCYDISQLIKQSLEIIKQNLVAKKTN